MTAARRQELTIEDVPAAMCEIARLTGLMVEQIATSLHRFAQCIDTNEPGLPQNPRQKALAAKQQRGTGPPSSSGWRGRERTTKYQRR